MARYYRSVEGRFNTPDPGHVGGNVGDPQSWNAYAYSRNDPVNFVDPSGTEYQICPWDEDCSGGFILSDRGFDTFVAIGGYVIDGSILRFAFPGSDNIDSSPLYYFFRTSIDGPDQRETDQNVGNMVTSLRRVVSEGRVSDCRVMASFADYAARDGVGALARAMSLLMSRELKTRAAIRFPSGFKAPYVNTNEGQSHHFAAFFNTGYAWGAIPVSGPFAARFVAPLAWEFASNAARRAPLDVPDIRLGRAAAVLGVELANGKIKVGQVGDRIRNDICR